MQILKGKIASGAFKTATEIIVGVVVGVIAIRQGIITFNKNNEPEDVTIIDISCENSDKCTYNELKFGVFDNENAKLAWTDSTNLKIFQNSIYYVDNIIVPETGGTYQFVVKNDTDYKLKYNIAFIENNPYSISMRYKLKKNGEYLISGYSSANELYIENQEINNNSSDVFNLEWYWASGPNDTLAGNEQADYSLKIEVGAESVND